MPVSVKWTNNLPSRHLLPVDQTLHGAMGNPDVRTVVHLHGAKVLPNSDGRPEAWFTNGFAHVGPDFDPAFKTYMYPNDQAATTLWYHDHAIGITRLNVHAGLAGFYLVRDDHEDALNLPKGRYRSRCSSRTADSTPTGRCTFQSATGRIPIRACLPYGPRSSSATPSR